MLELIYIGQIPGDDFNRPVMKITGIEGLHCAYLFPGFWKSPGMAIPNRDLIYLPSNQEASFEDLRQFFSYCDWPYWKLSHCDKANSLLSFETYFLGRSHEPIDDVRKFLGEIFKDAGEDFTVTDYIDDFINDIDRWCDKHY